MSFIDPWATIIVFVATEPNGKIREVLWFHEETFENTRHLALKRAIDWCIAHDVDVDFMAHPPVKPTTPGDWRMLIAEGPPYRVELWGQQRTL